MKKNEKRGFTLVELLGVIIILGIIATITVPLVQRTILENAEEAYNDQVAIFEKAAKNYVASNPYVMASRCSQTICTVSLEQLQEEGLLDSGEIINPLTDEPFNLENVVDITYDGETFSYSYDTSQDE